MGFGLWRNHHGYVDHLVVAGVGARFPWIRGVTVPNRVGRPGHWIFDYLEGKFAGAMISWADGRSRVGGTLLSDHVEGRAEARFRDASAGIEHIMSGSRI